MKKYITLSFLLLQGFISIGQLSVSWPIDRAIFQRNSSNQASVNIAGQVQCGYCPSGFPGFVFAKIKVLDKNGAETGSYIGSPSGFQLQGNSDGTFNSLTTISAGWYKLEVFNKDASGNVLNTITLKFGVGEVIYVAGQSNAQGFDDNNLLNPFSVTPTYYDCVNVPTGNLFCLNQFPAFPSFTSLGPYTPTSPNGNSGPWAYAYLGKRIADTFNVPVMFINTGVSGTSVGQWNNTANNQSSDEDHCKPITGIPETSNWVPNGQPYLGFKNALNYWGNILGARTVLWHQGEADNNSTTTAASYELDLENVILKSRNHIGNNSLGWSISKVSYVNGVTDNAPLMGQTNAKGSTSNTSWGAQNSDGIGAWGRQPDNIHFKENGLVNLGDQYHAEIFSITSLPPVTHGSIPLIYVSSSSGSSKTLTAPGGSSYCWVSGNGSLKRDFNGNVDVNDCYSINQSITVSSGSYRCYVYTPTNAFSGTGGQVRLSQKIHVGFVTSGFRIAATKTPVETSAYPNPFIEDVNITFELPYDAKAKVEILDRAGRVLKEIANSTHDKGSYTYPVKITSKSEFYYYRVTVDDESITKKLLKE